MSRIGSGVNSISAKTIYPSAPGQSLGVAGSTGSIPDDVMDATSDAKVAGAISTGGYPIVWWGIFLGLLLVLGFLAKRFGSEGGSFTSIKLSFYNVLIVGFMAILGINFAKIAVSAIPGVPKSLRDFILAV